ncbi:phage tail tip lysozyme [Actinocatenispora sera]|uniref:Phage tail lysozyme domain-containing protein n=1 Tax=Actinocatenispora sera TaxID=390989 RepID=A0A810L1G7_9ACTN|nr:phage tail tip lysozyme [Actinocatenispora sera]BCJ29253.1 hypothetical protein Asera_33610 [Actinocatenispora sera]
MFRSGKARVAILTATLAGALTLAGTTAPAQASPQTGAATVKAGSHGGMSPNNSPIAPSVITQNEQAAFNYFVAKGLTAQQSAGIIGNLDQESGMDPTIWEYGGGPGRGIAQWSAGGRWDTDPGDNVAEFAAGGNVYDLTLQLNFIWFELTSFPGYGLGDLQAAGTIDDAVLAFQNKYEICGACNSTNRINFAYAAYNAYAG